MGRLLQKFHFPIEVVFNSVEKQKVAGFVEFFANFFLLEYDIN